MARSVKRKNDVIEPGREKLGWRTNLSWISETCDLVSGHLWTDRNSLENRKGKEEKKERRMKNVSKHRIRQLATFIPKKVWFSLWGNKKTRKLADKEAGKGIGNQRGIAKRMYRFSRLVCWVVGSPAEEVGPSSRRPPSRSRISCYRGRDLSGHRLPLCRTRLCPFLQTPTSRA